MRIRRATADRGSTRSGALATRTGRGPAAQPDARNFEPDALGAVRIRRIDGAVAWKYLD
jgi:hypothetical protein